MDPTVALYRRCFSTHDGRKVLANILADLGIFDEEADDTHEEIALRKYGAKLLKNCGFTTTYTQVESLIDKCFDIQPTERKPDV